MTLHRLTLTSILTLAACNGPPTKTTSPVSTDIPIDQLDKTAHLLGRLHQPLGKVITVQGVISEGEFKGYEGGLNLRAQRIEGVATQEDIQIRIEPFFGEFGKEKGFTALGQDKLPDIHVGMTYEFVGYETGGYIGIPDIWDGHQSPIQESGWQFLSSFDVVTVKEIAPISFGPSDFVGQRALLQGSAVSRGTERQIAGNGWTLVTGNTPWPSWMEGKAVEAFGTIRPTPTPALFHMEKPTERLVNLADMLGHPVELRGFAWDSYEWAWFDYRGQFLYMDDVKDLDALREVCFRPLVVRGVLARDLRPDRNQEGRVAHPPLKLCYVIKHPTWELTTPLLGPERSLDTPSALSRK